MSAAPTNIIEQLTRVAANMEYEGFRPSLTEVDICRRAANDLEMVNEALRGERLQILRLEEANVRLTAEVERLKAARKQIYDWMREPDHVESANLEWLADWINRRPLAALSGTDAPAGREEG